MPLPCAACLRNVWASVLSIIENDSKPTMLRRRNQKQEKLDRRDSNSCDLAHFQRNRTIHCSQLIQDGEVIMLRQRYDITRQAVPCIGKLFRLSLQFR